MVICRHVISLDPPLFSSVPKAPSYEPTDTNKLKWQYVGVVVQWLASPVDPGSIPERCKLTVCRFKCCWLHFLRNKGKSDTRLINCFRFSVL